MTLPLSPEELAQRARAVDPTALLVPPRILRRVIKKHRGLGGLGLRVPHARSYLIDRAALLRIAGAGELGVSEVSALPDNVLLVPLPDEAALRCCPADRALRDVWRLLFHGEIDRALGGVPFAAAGLGERIERIGRTSFEEARAVLSQENDLFDPGDDSEVYREFAAVYLELRHFEPHRVAQFFPTILDFSRVDAVLAGDVDAEALLARTRPTGAAEAAAPPAPPEAAPAPPPAVETAAPGALRAWADDMARRGNLARAAILRYKALRLAPPTQAGGLRGAARHEVEQLVCRLERALHLPAGDRGDWTSCLMALLEPAARGFWPVEARLLYDLQKACVDNERAIFAADLVEWLVSGFQRPIKRPLPDQPLVLTVQHLRTALGRLPAAHVGDQERQRLHELLETALHDAEQRLRQRLRPQLVAALDAAGLAPRNAAEERSRDRLAEELLDLVAQRRSLTMSDLRDALARSRIKLPDLRGPVEFVTGDPLIRANRRMSEALDGVYHRGEIYLRWLQRLTSLFFGNPVGRVLALWVLLPVIGSFFILKGLNAVLEEAHKYLHVPEVQTTHLHSRFGLGPWTFDIVSYAVLALFLVPLLHWPAFRQAVGVGLHVVWLAVRGLLVDLPAAVLRVPLIRHVLQSKAYLVFYQYLGKPLVLTLPVTAGLWLAGAEPEWALGLSAVVLLLVSALTNTTLVLVAEEMATDWLVRTWHLVRDDLLPGLFRYVIYIFNRFKESVERVIYTVDEWLRFRSGESSLSFTVKLVLGLLWFVITYVVRFLVNLMIEPTVNPIKHFPAVTVAAKLLLPFWVPLTEFFAAPFFFLGRPLAYAIGSVPVHLLPGLAGFLAWELKENWRLYRANAAATLEPEMVGSHGEHVIQLMRPGFHSGTLPRLYARLRRAGGARERKHEEALHHVEEAVRRFVQRELIDYLTHSRAWGLSASLAVGEVPLATNRIRIELCCAALAGDSVLLDLEHEGGRLLADVSRSGWLGTLTAQQRAVFATALTGLYKKAGVDLVWQHLRAVLPAGVVVDVKRDGLFVWADVGRTNGMVYDLDQPDEPARPIGACGLEAPPTARDLAFAARPVTWSAWVEQWEQDRAGQPHRPLLPGFVLLPAAPLREEAAALPAGSQQAAGQPV